MNQIETEANIEKNEENTILYKFNLIVANHVEINASHGKLSFEGNNLYICIKSKSTTKELYEKTAETFHIEEGHFSLWIIENGNLIRSKIEQTENILVDEIVESGFNDIFVHFSDQETDGNSIFLIFTYFQNSVPAIRLMFTIKQPETLSFNDLFDKYCDITNCELNTSFTIAYRINDYELKYINEDQYDDKISNFSDISSIIMLQPLNLSNILLENRQIIPQYSHEINYLDKGLMVFPDTIDELIEIAKNMKNVTVIIPPPTSKILSTSEISFLFRFPPSISYDNFKFFIASVFAQNGYIKTNQNFLLYPEFSNKALDFDSNGNLISMEEVMQTVGFEKIYFYDFPFVNYMCMLNTSRLFLIRPNNQGMITHFFRDDTPIYKIIEFSYLKQWFRSKDPFILVYRKKKNGLIKSQVNPLLTAIEVKNPIYFCTFHSSDWPFNSKDIFIPVELIKTNENSVSYVESNFLLKVIPEEVFKDTLIRLQNICGELPEDCKFRIFNKSNGEVDLDDESVLSYEEDIRLRIYTA